MSRIRCVCTTGDVPHSGATLHWPRRPKSYGSLKQHKRCTRTATVQIRRVRSTDGRRMLKDGAWYDYCEPCAQAIERYQGSDVERKG